jgi:hypothetical protein
VHLLTRLATMLDLLHTHGKRIHGNLTPHHVLIDTSESPATLTLIDFSCSRMIGGALWLFAFSPPRFLPLRLRRCTQPLRMDMHAQALHARVGIHAYACALQLPDQACRIKAGWGRSNARGTRGRATAVLQRHRTHRGASTMLRLLRRRW